MTSKPPSERKTSAQQQPTIAPRGHSVPSRGTGVGNPQHLTFGHNSPQKNMPRRSSKPFINWFQRKLSGSVKGKRPDTIALGVQRLGRNGSRSNSSRANGRIVPPSPVPNNPTQSNRQRDRLDVTSAARSKTVSLNGDDDFHSYDGEDSADTSDRLSMARDSLWSPASMVEADDDASLRPLPPSAPPSPVPSRSSSSYLSDPRTFRSIAASTKPTTVLSIDLPGNGMAHIAQVPVTSSSHRLTHMRQSPSGSPHVIGNAAVTFSALQSQSSRLASHQLHASSPVSPVQAPLHTTHHPRNNPRPASPPLDNASLLTLASSAYALPARSGPQVYGSTPPSAFSGGDSTSHFGGSMFPDAESSSLFVSGEDAADERDASVRALRPRSSRRGSWGSELSGWSAQMLHVPGTPNLDRSVFISNSLSSTETNTENGKDMQENLDEGDEGGDTDTSPQSRAMGENGLDDSIDTSHISTDGSAVQCEPDTSTRACYRSISLDTVGQNTTDKDLSTAMSSFEIEDEQKSASD
ncbi:hypothetical protein Agabi119p4_4486 [Agaricus bisporus var. burnettii]|uniref:Uncharacterized protein n=1 Tax=Agaricus bisporus var. burnettii TaxID=192524 RepID=A0A8H7F3I8_AGABI|nr:hypothetical protein Agabi119p4_4486 [Agaricus bisporus var. burnettii]